jgi:hypothetical protein
MACIPSNRGIELIGLSGIILDILQLDPNDNFVKQLEKE